MDSSHDRDHDGAGTNGPVSKLELLRLRRQERPALTLECNLGDGAVARKLDQLRARTRANYIEDRLQNAKGAADRGFTKAALTGRARRDFEQSR